MEQYLILFTTREQAIAIWIAVFIIWAVFQKNIRTSILGLFGAFLQKQIIIAFTAMFLYVALAVYLFSQFQLWEAALLKETIFWLFGTALVLFMTLNKASEDQHYFRKIVSDNLKLVLVLIFIINFYTFHLLIELVLVPLIFIIVMMNAVAELKDEYLPVKKLTDFIMAAWGIFIAVFAIISALGDYQNLLTADNLRTFLLPLFLTLAFLPFLYSFAVFMAYENIFVRLNISVGKRDENLARKAKRKIFKVFGANLGRLNKFSKENIGKLWGLKSETELIEIIEKFEN
ncbi:MAG: hypothetical protein WDZ80_04315 [Candidatus Paceibacterota bacterium]